VTELYPIMIDLKGRRVTVIGGGAVALRKAEDLLRCGARVHIIAPRMHAGFGRLAEQYGDQLEVAAREYQHGDIGESLLVIAATDDAAVNRAVFTEARERSILINAVDDPPNCSFFLPSSYCKGDLIMSLSTGGASPAMAARLRRELQKHIPDTIDATLEALNEARSILKKGASFGQIDTAARGQILKSIVNDDVRLDELRAAFEHGGLEDFLLGFL